MRTGRLLKTAAILFAVLGCANAPSRPAEARRAAAVVSVPPTGDLQRALDDAQPGDTIVLTAGARYVGPFRLRRKSGDGWITIQSAASILRKVPPTGIRVQPADAAAMAKILAPGEPALIADPGAHHYRFVGLEMAPTPGVFVANVVDLGNARSLDAVAHHFVFERCYIHGDREKGSRRGIAMNSGETIVRDSYLSDFKEVGNDSQALAAWNGPGPFQVVNNFLEAAGENILFGGGDPAIPNLVPSDIAILRNTMAKPLAWRIGDPGYQGTPWTVKNILELKNARRVRIEGNVLEYNWPHAQNGFAILFTVRNQDGGAPWSVIEDVAFINNVVRHVGSGVNILGRDDINRSEQAKRILIRNNLFTDVGGDWGQGRLFQLLNGAASVVIDHNTAMHTETLVLGGDSLPHTGFVFENNIAAHNQYGIIGGGTGVGKPTLERYFPGAVIRRNVIAGGNASLYPGDNFFPGGLDDVKWADAANGNFRLSAASPFRARGTDGRDLGADLNAIQASMAGRTPPVEDRRWPVPGPNPSRDLGIGRAGFVPIGEWPSFETTAAALFVLSSAAIVYVYVGYGGAMWWLARRRPRPVARRDVAPSVSVVVVAYNEAGRIERRIANLLALDYPRDRIEVVVASDGSVDGTGAVAARYQDRIRVFDFPVRRGKPAVLNDVIPQLRSEIVVLADARQEFAPDAVSALAACLADETVGAVSGELILRRPESATAAAQGAAVYWSYEKLIRWSESQVDSCIGATGAIYAIRRSLFEPLPVDTILDDVLIPLRITRQGYRVVFEPRARAFDRPPAAADEEFMRKVRTIAGNVQLFARERWLLRPAENRLWLQTFSHKAMRLLLPALYAVVFGTNLVLVDAGIVFQAAMAGQLAFYAVALAGYLAPPLRTSVPLLVVPYEICFLNWAALVGVLKYVTRRQRVTWDRPSAAPAS